MHLHLFSANNDPLLADVLDPLRPLLESQRDPVVAYLPAASLVRHFVRETRAAFRRLATVVPILVESHPLDRIRAALDRAALLYVPGGNTYLMAHRLHTLGLMDELRQRLRAGLPYLGVSAGMMICGMDILTTNDLNPCGCVAFDGLGLVPFNFNAHYPPTPGEARDERDDRLREYLAFHDHPVLAMQDDAYLRVTDRGMELVRGTCWRLERGKPAVRI